MFITDPEFDINNDYTLDFTAAMARIIKKPPRDKTDRVIQEHIQFYRSEIPWIAKLKLFKVN